MADVIKIVNAILNRPKNSWVWWTCHRNRRRWASSLSFWSVVDLSWKSNGESVEFTTGIFCVIWSTNDHKVLFFRYLFWLAGLVILVTRAVDSESRSQEPEGFRTWGVSENFNDSDSGLTLYLPIVTVCATNVRKRHTWQFKQLNVSTRDDHGYSERLQHTNLNTYTQGRFEVSSVTRAYHATFTQWMQPFEACVTEISICFHSGWH